MDESQIKGPGYSAKVQLELVIYGSVYQLAATSDTDVRVRGDEKFIEGMQVDAPYLVGKSAYIDTWIDGKGSRRKVRITGVDGDTVSYEPTE